jgi:hypothetical protein
LHRSDGGFLLRHLGDLVSARWLSYEGKHRRSGRQGTRKASLRTVRVVNPGEANHRRSRDSACTMCGSGMRVRVQRMPRSRLCLVALAGLLHSSPYPTPGFFEIPLNLAAALQAKRQVASHNRDGQKEHTRPNSVPVRLSLCETLDFADSQQDAGDSGHPID